MPRTLLSTLMEKISVDFPFQWSGPKRVRTTTNACPRSDLTPAKASRTSAASTATGVATLPKSATLRSGIGRGTVTIRDRVPALETATVAANTATVDPAATTTGTGTTIEAAGVVDVRHLAAVVETAFPVSVIAEVTVTIEGTMTLADADTEAVVVMVSETVRTKGGGVRHTHARAMEVSINAGETTRRETAETRVGRGRLQDGVVESNDTAGLGEATQVSRVLLMWLGVESGAPYDNRREERSGGQSQREELQKRHEEAADVNRQEDQGGVH